MQTIDEEAALLSNVKNNLQLWDHDYDWAADGDEWEYQADRSGLPYSEWKSSLVSHLIEPYARGADVIEIAPGHGRWSEFIINMCRHVTLVDLGPKCLEYCRTRFAAHANVDYFLTTGTQLPYHAAGAIDFVFSYDSFVHMSADVIQSYMAEIARVLKTGRTAIIHHAEIADPASYHQTYTGQRSAINSSMVRGFAEQHGLTVVRQFRLWDEARNIGCAEDAITAVTK
jgi:ubiquinone/menaquinone biosynthesis C-methylase UbiE